MQLHSLVSIHVVAPPAYRPCGLYGATHVPQCFQKQSQPAYRFMFHPSGGRCFVGVAAMTAAAWKQRNWIEGLLCANCVVPVR